MAKFTECVGQGKFKVRSKDNTDWLDACEYETYIRNESNTGWLRIVAGKAVVRHGTNKCWVLIGCEENKVDPCGLEYSEAGLTPSGKSPAATASTTVAPDGTTTTITNNPDGTTTTTVTPADGGAPVTTIAQTPTAGTPGAPGGLGTPSGSILLSTYASVVGGGASSGTYTNNVSGVGGTYTNNVSGGSGGGGTSGNNFNYTPGGGLGIAISAGVPGTPGNPVGSLNCINVPGEPDCIPLDPVGCMSTSNAGTVADPMSCGLVIWSCQSSERPLNNASCYRIQEIIFDVGTDSGTITLSFVVQGKVSFEIQYGNQYVRTDGFFWSEAAAPKPAPVLLFKYVYDSNIGQLIKVRTIRQDGCGLTSTFNYHLACPSAPKVYPKDANGLPIIYGTPVTPAPCDATIDPDQFGGQGLISVTHDLGTTSGIAYIDYQMWYQPDKMDVFQEAKLIASTGDYVTGTGQLQVNFDASKGRNIVVRIHARDPGTSWGYRMSCPGVRGREGDPKPCTDQFESSGAGITDTFVDCGPTAGMMIVDYNAWYVADSIEIYQSGALLASTNGYVTGISALTFAYNPANGTNIMIRVIGDPGSSTWGIKLTCPVPSFPILSIQETTVGAGISVQENVATGVVSIDVCGDIPAQSDITFDYYTQDVTAKSRAVSAQELVADPAGNTVISVVDDIGPNGEQIRLVLDGGFTKYTNNAYSSAGTDFASLPGQFQYLYNVIKWIANPAKLSIGNKKLMILGDVDLGTDYCVADANTPPGFANSLVNVAIMAGFDPYPIIPSDVGGVPMSSPYPELEQFCCTIVVSSYSGDATQFSQGVSAMFSRYLTEGNGLMIITQSGPHQGTANDIISKFGVQFQGVADVPDLSQAYLSSNYGSHPLWSNMTKPMVEAPDMGRVIVDPTSSDFKPTFGTITIPKGQTCVTIDVPIIDDTVQEADDTFQFIIYSPTNVDSSDTSGYIRTVTIVNDDFPILQCGLPMTQAASNSVRVSLGATSGLVEVMYATDGGEGSPATIIAKLGSTVVGSSLGSTLISLLAPVSMVFFYDASAQTNTLTIEATGDLTWYYSCLCPRGPTQINALIFSTSIEVENRKQSYTPPSPQDIFNTWARTDGNAYYANVSSAAGAAASWQLVNGNILMPDNAGQVNTVISNEVFSSYLHEVTFLSDAQDDDGIGAVMAFARVNGENHILALVRTKGGLTPVKGCAIVYFSPSFGLGFGGGLEILVSYPDLQTPGPGDVWANNYTKVSVERAGNLFTVKVGAWNSNTYNHPYATLTLDLTQASSNRTDLSVFLGSTPYGYLSTSQANTTYRDINFVGGSGPQERMFDAETGNVWEYIGSSWQLVGRDNWDTYFGKYANITNPITHTTWQQKDNVNVSTMTPFNPAYILGSRPEFTMLGLTGIQAGLVSVAEKTFLAYAGNYIMKAAADDLGEIFVNGISYGQLSMTVSPPIQVSLISGLNVITVQIIDTVGGATGFGMSIPGLVSSDDFNGWSGALVP